MDYFNVKEYCLQNENDMALECLNDFWIVFNLDKPIVNNFIPHSLYPFEKEARFYFNNKTKNGKRTFMCQIKIKNNTLDFVNKEKFPPNSDLKLVHVSKPKEPYNVFIAD